MKKWIRNLTDDDLENVFKDMDMLETTSDNIDVKIKELILNKNYVKTDKLIEKRTAANYQFKRPLIVSAVFLITASFALLFNLFYSSNTGTQKIAYITEINGVFDKYTENNGFNLKRGTKIVNGTTLSSGKNSESSVQIGFDTIIQLKENTSIDFTEVPEFSKKTNIKVNYGRILVSINKKLNDGFVINTSEAEITITGTSFLVDKTSKDSTYISLSHGQLKIKIFATDNTVYLNKNESLLITPQGTKSDKILENDKKEIDNMKVLDKNKLEKVVNNKQQQNTLISWEGQKIYEFDTSINPGKNKIIGITGNDNFVVVQSESAIVCFNNHGVKIWEKYFGNKDGLFFMATPVIYNNKLFLSSLNDRLLVLDLITGKVIKAINTNRNITFGFSAVLYNKSLYLPYRDGLYKLDTESLLLIDKNPFIYFNNPVTPLISDDKIYLTSFIDKALSVYDLNGKLIHEITVKSSTFSKPQIYKDNIYTLDNSGNIYKFSPDGRVLSSIKIDSKITSDFSISNNSLYFVGDNGWLYKVSDDLSNSKKLFQLDKTPDVSTYLFKSPECYGDNLIVGSDNGEIILFDINQNKIITNVKLTNNKIISPVFYNNHFYFSGSDNGEIFLLKEKIFFKN